MLDIIIRQDLNSGLTICAKRFATELFTLKSNNPKFTKQNIINYLSPELKMCLDLYEIADPFDLIILKKY